jgi:hypothetical protein
LLVALLRPATALGGASADQIALHIREAAENSKSFWAPSGREVAGIEKSLQKRYIDA